MTWLDCHAQSEKYASDAEVAVRQGEDARARELYRMSAQAEEQALEEVEPNKRRTYSVTAVSAVALYFKAAQWRKAQILAYRCLESERMLKFARRQMEDILDAIETNRIGAGQSCQRRHSGETIASDTSI